MRVGPRSCSHFATIVVASCPAYAAEEASVESPAPAPVDAVPGARVEGLVELAMASSYVWRGDLYSADLLDPLVTPYAELTLNEVGPGALTFSLFGLIPTGTDPPLEVDPLVAYGVAPASWVELTLGYTVYLGLDPVDDTMHEVLLDAAWLPALLLHPVAGIAVDPMVTHGAYAYAGLALAAAGDTLSLDAQLTGGVSGYEGVRFGLQDVTAQAVGSASIAGPLYASLIGGLGLALRTSDANPNGALALGVAF